MNIFVRLFFTTFDVESISKHHQGLVVIVRRISWRSSKISCCSGNHWCCAPTDIARSSCNLLWDWENLRHWWDQHTFNIAWTFDCQRHFFALDPTQFVNRSKSVDWSKEMIQKYDRDASKHVYDIVTGMNRGFTRMSPKINSSRLYTCF